MPKRAEVLHRRASRSLLDVKPICLAVRLHRCGAVDGEGRFRKSATGR